MIGADAMNRDGGTTNYKVVLQVAGEEDVAVWYVSTDDANTLFRKIICMYLASDFMS